MASIHKEILIKARPEHVWAAVSISAFQEQATATMKQTLEEEAAR